MRTPLLIFSVVVSLLVLAAPASSVPPPAPSPDQSFGLKYTTGKPGVRTGLRFGLGERVPETAGVPKLRTVTVTLPARMRLDRSVATRFCRERDSAPIFPTYGARCLPAAIGAGNVDVLSPPGPTQQELESSLVVYNTRRGALIQGLAFPSGISVTFRGREMTLTFPTPGSSVLRLDFYLNPVSQRRRVRRHGRTVVVRRNYFTTPARCPRSGAWSSSVQATFYDDPTPRTSVSTSRCRR